MPSKIMQRALNLQERFVKPARLVVQDPQVQRLYISGAATLRERDSMRAAQAMADLRGCTPPVRRRGPVK
jgi:hypothetical protein